MNKKIITILTLILFLGVGIYIYQNQTSQNEEKKVAATIFPLYDIVRNIAGENVDVELVLPPGASPHTYEPLPSDTIAIANSAALFVIGHGLDNWSETIANSANIDKVISADKNITLLDSDHEHDHQEDEHESEEDHGEDIHDDEDGHEEEGKDPHYWLSIPNAILISSQIRDELKLLYPEYSSDFDNNYEEYAEKLSNLNEEIESDLSELPNNNISTFHNAWAYFANDHNVNIIATFEEYPGEEPSIRYLSEFQEKIRTENVNVIFSEPQFSTKPLESIANDLGVSISQLDPLGGIEDRDSYESLMRFNANMIIEAVE